MSWLTFEGWTGEGKKYDSEKRDWTGSEKIFGYPPFKGTLNVAIRPALVGSEAGPAIAPFKDFRCYEGTINGIEAWMCKSIYNSTPTTTLYVISKKRLRDSITETKVQIKIKRRKTCLE